MMGLDDMKQTHVFLEGKYLKLAAHRSWICINHRAHMGCYFDQNAALWEETTSQDAFLASEFLNLYLVLDTQPLGTLELF